MAIKSTGSNPLTEYIAALGLGLSIGVLLATLYAELYGLQFVVGCRYSLGPTHGDDIREINIQESLSKPIRFDDLNDEHHKGGDAIAKALENKVKVLCWVMTSPDRLGTHVKALKETWGRRCNLLLFMSTEENNNIPGVINLQAIGADVQNVWSKTRAAWKYVYEKHLNDADWFLAADDTTYVIAENLRLLLSKFDPKNTVYLGRWYKTSGGYNTESTGYVFSKGTLKTFMRAMNNPMKCKVESDLVDSNVGKCLAAFDVHPSDSRDPKGRETFHPFAPEYHVVPDAIKSHHWIHSSNRFPVRSGPESCSVRSVLFHGLNHDTLYILEYLVYHLKPYGFNQI